VFIFFFETVGTQKNEGGGLWKKKKDTAKKKKGTLTMSCPSPFLPHQRRKKGGDIRSKKKKKKKPKEYRPAVRHYLLQPPTEWGKEGGGGRKEGLREAGPLDSRIELGFPVFAYQQEGKGRGRKKAIKKGKREHAGISLPTTPHYFLNREIQEVKEKGGRFWARKRKKKNSFDALSVPSARLRACASPPPPEKKKRRDLK